MRSGSATLLRRLSRQKPGVVVTLHRNSSTGTCIMICICTRELSLFSAKLGAYTFRRVGRWFRAAAAASNSQSTQVGCEAPRRSFVCSVRAASCSTLCRRRQTASGTGRVRLLLQQLLHAACHVLCNASPTSRQGSKQASAFLVLAGYILCRAFALQGVWARMSDAIDRTWQALDEDLHREEAEFPFQLERSLLHSIAGCACMHIPLDKHSSFVVHLPWWPFVFQVKNNLRWSEVHHCCYRYW